ncbi:hypothetical protein F4561_005719 [Lipingzhangella halophila]|uniref:Uncharacterized protein n=1 Tax=Lipingzhangella halophila TaxID=1783352 RepID=A0A7W7RMQ1_9ACTN|nr:hypothetical protein [Lipingzhangella halophila]MBB4934825.1 hypothetical protein [Lipingzhangella halophila]
MSVFHYGHYSARSQGRALFTARDGSGAGNAWRGAGWWGFGLAVGYAVFVRFYHAAGGTIGIPGQLESPHVFAMASYLAGLLILVGGLACLYLALPRVRAIPRRFPWRPGEQIPAWLLVPLCLLPTLIGAVYAVAHALIGFSTKTLDLFGLVRLEYPDVWQNLDRTAMALWEIFFYEPWFLAMGVCLALCGLRYLRDLGLGARTVRSAAWALAGAAVLLAVAGTGALVLDGTLSAG